MERPILFNDAMVRAILSGSKTQTRRPVKAPKAWQHVEVVDRSGTLTPIVDREPNVIGGNWADLQCPFGVPGDRLWVREAHAVTSHHAPDDYPHIFYRADGAAHQHNGRSVDSSPDSSAYKHKGKWTPSIHMPRWASRLTLRVTHVRVERLQAITAADAVAEGVFGEGRYAKAEGIPYPVATFADLWRDTCGPESWAANPWVWVVAFERVEAGQ